MQHNSFRTRLSSLQRRAKKIFSRGFTIKKSPGRLLFSSVDLIVPSFAAMEITNQFKQVFKVIDANGDGKLSSYELSELLVCVGLEKSKARKEAEGLVREMDGNGDGFVELDEFMDTLNSDGKFNEEDNLMDAFSIFDGDKNGLISAKELHEVLTKLGCNKCSIKECRRMIKGVDQDGDGFVDFEEFRAMMTTSLG